MTEGTGQMARQKKRHQADLEHLKEHFHDTVYTRRTRQKKRHQSGPKKRHQADLVMRVQSSMALIDNTLKNISMTLYTQDRHGKKSGIKADQKSGIKRTWSCRFNHQWL